jgi:hypothetical protein
MEERWARGGCDKGVCLRRNWGTGVLVGDRPLRLFDFFDLVLASVRVG